MSQADLLLKNGTVIDGTGRSRFRADVAINDCRIVAVSPSSGAAATRTLDCSGLILAPGFIDTHSHSDLRVLSEPQLPMKVRQGITLELFGQDGISVAPIRVEDHPQMEQQLAGLLGRLDREWDWQTVGEYLTAVEHAGPSLDCAYLVPHGAVRLSVMGMEDRPATADELSKMKDLIRASLREGAAGLSTGLIYPPCCFAGTSELIELCCTVAEFDAVFVAHMRSESDYLEDAVAEMIEVGRESGARIHISHFKAAGRENWKAIDHVLDMISGAEQRGMRLTADQYPYIAGSTMLGAILPPWAHAGGVDATLEKLRSPEERGRMKEAMLDRSRSTWDNFWKWSGPEGIIISDIPSGNNTEYVGKSLDRAAIIRRNASSGVSDEDAIEFAFDLLLEERMGVGMISFSQSEDVVKKIMRQPYVNVCTDGLLGGKPHPRAYGTYPRILGRYVREQNLLSLEEAVRKMTSLAASTFRLAEHGSIEAGKRANIVVFDEERILDRATFEESRQYPEGISYVIVGGRVTVEGDRQSETGSGITVSPEPIA